MRSHFFRYILAAAIFSAGAVFGQSAPAVRFPQVKLEETSGEQRAMAERMMKETRSGIGGPWNVALRSPTMAQGFLELYNYYRYKSSLPTRLVEVGICTTAREFDVAYEWQAHYPLAVAAGVSSAALADLRDGKSPRGLKADEQAVYDFSVEFLRKHYVSDATFARAKSELGEKGVVDLAALVGTYVTFGAILNVGQVPNVRPEDSLEYLPIIRK